MKGVVVAGVFWVALALDGGRGGGGGEGGGRVRFGCGGHIAEM